MAVTVLRGQACGTPGTAPTNPDGEFWLQRFWRAYGPLDVVIPPLKIGHRIFEQRLDDLHRLFSSVQALQLIWGGKDAYVDERGVELTGRYVRRGEG